MGSNVNSICDNQSLRKYKHSLLARIIRISNVRPLHEQGSNIPSNDDFLLVKVEALRLNQGI